MIRRTLYTFAALVVAVGLVAAAEPIKIALKDFKLKPKNEGTSPELMGYNEGEEKLFYYVAGTATAEVKVPEDGEYTLTIEASCDEANKEKAKIKVMIGDDVVAKEFELKQVEAKTYEFTAKLKKGTPKLSIEFLNDLYKDGEYDMNFYLHSVKLEEKK